MKHLLSILILLLIISCKSDPTTPNPVPPAPKIENPTPPKPDLDTQKWNAFWEQFKTAVANDDAEKVADFTVFPLPGSEPVGNGNPISRKYFLANYTKIFDKETKETVAKTTANMADFAVKKEATAKRLHVPVNTKVRSINVLYIYDKGTDLQTESSIIYHFAKIGGKYKLVSAIMAG